MKIDCDYQVEKLVFSLEDGKKILVSKTKEVDPTFKTVEFKYHLTDGSSTYDLQSHIKLGLFEPHGWNCFKIENNSL